MIKKKTTLNKKPYKSGNLISISSRVNKILKYCLFEITKTKKCVQIKKPASLNSPTNSNNNTAFPNTNTNTTVAAAAESTSSPQVQTNNTSSNNPNRTNTPSPRHLLKSLNEEPGK